MCCRCIPCPEGEYVDRTSQRCEPCPAGTVVHGVNAWGVDSCIQCGEGLTALHGSQCVTSCQFNSTDGRLYDFTPLAGYVYLLCVPLHNTVPASAGKEKAGTVHSVSG